MSNRQEPLVSVLTPVYNGEDFLAECIESVLKQTYQNYEYIVVNNCSTDRTLEIASAYAQKDNRIRIHNNDKFVAVIENHNISFRLISPDARYCKVVSADDHISPECITQLVECGEANPSAGMVGCYQLSGSYIRWQGFRHPAAVFSGVELCRRLFLGEQIFLGGQTIVGFGAPTSLLYRGELIRSSAEFYPNSSPHADTSACFRDLAKWDFGFVYQVLSYERTHEATQSHKSAQLNRYVSASLNDLTQYGSLYLDKAELDRCIDETLRGYHRFLALAYISGVRTPEFWDYHRGRLAELGYPLRRLALWKAALGAAASGLRNPGKAMRKLRRRASR